MTLFNRLDLKTKLVGSFIFIVFLSGVVAFIGIRLSIGQISQTVIPFLKNMGQVGELAKTVQAETIEYVIQGEAETREDLAESLDLLQSLATQVENTPTTDPAERATLDHLALVVNQTADLSDQIVQSHDDTLEQLEALEALEGETDLVFQEVVSLMEAQITTSLRTGIPDEGAMLAQQALSEFNSQAGRLHIEALEFAATGEDEAIEQFETAADRLAQAQRDLETIWQAAGADEAVLLNRLQRLKDEFERLGQGIFASHQQTLDLLAELERIEEEPAGVIAATQLVADNQANRQLTEANRNMLLFSTGVLALATLLGLSLANTITSPVDDLVAVARQVGDGQTDQRVRVTTRDEIGELAVVFNQMIDNLRQRISAEQTAREEAHQARVETEAANRLLEEQIWQITGQANLNERMRGEQNMVQLANSIILHLCRYLPAQLGALYLADESQLNLMGTFAHNGHQPVSRFGFGEGLVGQVAQEKTPLLIDKIPADYLTVRSGFGESPPRNLGLYPFMFEEQVIGVIELGSLTAFSPAQQSFLQTTMEAIGVTFHMAMTRARIQELLTVLQNQTEQLQAQEEELRAANEELEAQTESLRISESRLRQNQTELEQTNTQLEDKAAALEESALNLEAKQSILDNQNRALRVAQHELEQQAEALTRANHYKSEFLANMSHELRTPLNSLLILARILLDNDEGNLTEEQVEFANIIYGAGTDLLTLINDILDLSKVEAGSLLFEFKPMALPDLEAAMRAQFSHVAEDKGLAFKIELASDLPETIETDEQRVKQIIRNLLSNAFKFTDQGSVTLRISRPAEAIQLGLNKRPPAQVIALSVIDTGIGITADQQEIVFEAFKQADTGSSRQYGGTGLGLTISRELAARLGGKIEVTSQPEQGSCFTLFLPVNGQGPVSDVLPPRAQSQAETSLARTANHIPSALPTPATSTAPADDRDSLQAGEKILLVIDDDPQFAKVVYDFAHKQSFRCLIAGDGTSGLMLVDRYQPDALILDLHLPDISGWEVMAVLKHNPATRHIPVHIISADEEVVEAYRKGAMGFLTKPISAEDLLASFEKIEHFIATDIKSLLLVEDDPTARLGIKRLLGGSDVQITETDRGQTALKMLQTNHYDCLILDLSLPDMSGFEVLSKMNEQEGLAHCPVIVYTGRELTPDENMELMKYAESVIVKGVRSPERLLDETALFLHRVVARMPEEKQQTIRQLYNDDGRLQGKKVLIVDDDMRNCFALSRLLSDKGLIVHIASNGQKALDFLADQAVDLVLMDMMMPVMDGYEAMQQIRNLPQFRSLPILALTAKAMKGDQEKCLAAGANDYLPKPINIDRLYAMLRVWLYQ